MNIKKIVGIHPDVLQGHLHQAVQQTRFTATVTVVHGRRVSHVSIANVRLKQAKPYCGNHPGACVLAERTHRRLTYLEGADWVEFNDWLNAQLDALQVSANITSNADTPGGAPLWIRQGTKRRVQYEAAAESLQFGGRRNLTWEAKPERLTAWAEIGEPSEPSLFEAETPGHYPALSYAVEG